MYLKKNQGLVLCNLQPVYDIQYNEIELTNRKPEASVTQICIQAFASHAWLYSYIKVFLVKIKHLVHLPQAKTHTTLTSTLYV